MVLHVNWFAPRRAGRLSFSAPFFEKNHERPVVPGIGIFANDFSKPGYGWPGIGAGAVVEQDPDHVLFLERRERSLVGGLLLNRVGRQSDALDPERRLVDQRRRGADRGRVHDRRFLCHV